MDYNDIQINEEGFVTLSSLDEGVTKSSAFFLITPSMTFTTHLAKSETGLREDTETKDRICIYGAGKTTGHIPDYVVNFSERTLMELAADDLRNAMMDRIASRNIMPRRERPLRHVEMILQNPICMPTQGSEGSAGYDCFADIESMLAMAKFSLDGHTLTLAPGQCDLVPLGFKLLIGNPDFEARLVPRSGKGHKGLVLGNLTGTIDSDYEGVWHMSMWNRTDKPLVVDLREAVCQMVFDRVEHPRINLVDEFSEQGKTGRGTGGFGSTDRHRGDRA